jgi:GTPase
MIFVDEAKIVVAAGNGGKGCESYHRDRHHKYPIPNGGDGGRGGDVTLTASPSIHTLLDLQYKKHYDAENGKQGSSQGKKGKNGKSCTIRVPCGTIIRDAQTGLLIRDLVNPDDHVLVAKGGAGGIGNERRRIPKPPGKGQAHEIHLELKLIADVGLIGFPNAGKSTLISTISNAQSPIANYPFTTKYPVLGRVKDEDFSFIVADLPGIIEGAHAGRGLGDRFLRHAERTKALVQVLDMAGTEARDPLDDYVKLNAELELYSDALMAKHKLVVANKMDMEDAAKHLRRFKKKFPAEEIIPVSALTREGLDVLVQKMKALVC